MKGQNRMSEDYTIEISRWYVRNYVRKMICRL
jgi:hypothetical protein